MASFREVLSPVDQLHVVLCIGQKNVCNGLPVETLDVAMWERHGF